jgi:hypothetical protein
LEKKCHVRHDEVAFLTPVPAVGYGEYSGMGPSRQIQMPHLPPPEEEMIPVKRGGCMFFVPLSQATPEELKVHLGGSGAGKPIILPKVQSM